jgi:arginyl-tRNA synthetase
VEAASPGFLNFYLSAGFLHDALKKSLKEKKNPSTKLKASVEYISANPTGPMHIGNARGGPLGDVIANILAHVGYKVTREYFHNDAGAQIERYGNSLWHWYLVLSGKESVLSEDGYQGEYVKELAALAKKKFGLRLLKDPQGKKKLTEFVMARALAENIKLCKQVGIIFTKVTHESELAKKKTPKVLAELEKKGLLKKKEGAIWFSPGGQLGEREAVVIKSDGTPVYFANDIAYHKEKFARANLVVDELGEGHEGHIPKLRAIADVYGFSQERFKIVVHGQVTLKKDGHVVSMAKRKGNFVTAHEVLDVVGVDAFRFFMLQHAPKSAMQFDIELARERSKQNPVYYVQYAHARAAGILKKSKQKANLKKINWSLLESLPELSLIKQILALPEIIEKTASDFEVQRLTHYAYELARAFTHFYETTKVIDPERSRRVGEEKNLEASRLGLVLLARDTLRKVSKLLGISAPDKM